jgi:hypothetical protein
MCHPFYKLVEFVVVQPQFHSFPQLRRFPLYFVAQYNITGSFLAGLFDPYWLGKVSNVQIREWDVFLISP